MQCQCHYSSSTLLLPPESLQLRIGGSSSGASLASLKKTCALAVGLHVIAHVSTVEVDVHCGL